MKNVIKYLLKGFMIITVSIILCSCGPKVDLPAQSDGSDGSEQTASDDMGSDEIDGSDADDVSDDNYDDNNNDKAAKDDNAAVSEPAEKPEEKEASDELVKIRLFRKSDSDYKWSTADNLMLARMSYDTIAVESSQKADYKALSDALDKANEERSEDFKKEYKDLVSAAKADIKDFPKDFMCHEYTEDMKVRRADSIVVSMLSGTYLYTGGAHGMYGYHGYNYDARSGKELTIDDVVKDKDAFADVVEELVKKHWSDEDLFEGTSVAKYIKDPETVLQWTVDQEGVSVYFNPYEIAPYATGTLDVLVPFEKYHDLFVDRFMSASESYTCELFENQKTYTDPDGDGELNELLVSSTIDENEYKEKLIVTVDGQSAEQEAYVFSADPVLVKAKDGKYYVYIFTTSDNDYEQIYVFDINGDKPVYVDAFSGGMGWFVEEESEDSNFGDRILIDPYNMVLLSRTDLLSTISGEKTYSINENGMPESADKIYIFAHTISFTVKKSVKASVADEKTYGETGETVTLGKGDKVDYYGTDAEEYAYLKIVSGKAGPGRIVRVKVTIKDWQRYVDGKKIEKVFDGILFAG